MIFSGLDIAPPEKLFIGRGLSYFIKGWVYKPGAVLESVTVQLGSVTYSMDEIRQPRPDIINLLEDKIFSNPKNRSAPLPGFSGCIDLPGSLTGKIRVLSISTVFQDGTRHTIFQQQIRFLKPEEYFTPICLENDYDPQTPLIAICLATYRPDSLSFRKQIQSIINQSYPNWICIIHDDASGKETLDVIRSIIADDDRFYLKANDANLGYYRNFERSLCYVPEEAEYVAFSDQDDCWYPKKLGVLLSLLQTDNTANLAYSDMRICRKDGSVISETYWRRRQNHYHNLGMVMVCGTVTGAASLFRKKLLQTALPFPQDSGNAFHDHVISCAALATGRIVYYNQPLYDYIQHRENVIGHHEFSDESLAATVSREMKQLSSVKAKLQSLYGNYEINYTRLRLISRSFLLRGCKPCWSLLLFNHTYASVARLFLLHLKVRLQQHTTEHAEIVIALSFVIRKIGRFLFSDNPRECL